LTINVTTQPHFMGQIWYPWLQTVKTWNQHESKH